MHVHSLEARIAQVEGGFTQMNERLGSLERRLDSFEHLTISRFDQVDRRFESLEHRLDSRFGQIDGRFSGIDRRFNWLTGIVLGTWVTMMLAIHFHI